MKNITVQNNWFAPTLVGNSRLNWNPTRDCPGAVVGTTPYVGAGHRFECSQNGSAQLYGNIVPKLDSFWCGGTKAQQHHNIADSGSAVPSCGAGTLIAADGRVDFVDRSGGDYHLTPGSEATGRGDPANYTGDDIDGDSRPMSGNPDAGADER